MREEAQRSVKESNDQGWLAQTERTRRGGAYCPTGVRNVSGIAGSVGLHGRPQLHGAALALNPRQGDRGARRRPVDRIERSHALGIVRVLRSLGYSRDELFAMKVQDFDPDFGGSAWPSHWQSLKETAALTNRVPLYP